jgi:hypothetical protein
MENKIAPPKGSSLIKLYGIEHYLVRYLKDDKRFRCFIPVSMVEEGDLEKIREYVKENEKEWKLN